ncbi:hypothetical protein C823_000397 [Eubacterium plexicaudatum ASF492]|uniref:DUF1349 domain-containing protein n=1 Tax=Eubacterium plexicaudatum ASF492 TaxID=1235802 RepID=N2A6C9_9FIRM|nr:hypothetical protein C823_000397 [Eubacterium plexicaudatum ASF492]
MKFEKKNLFWIREADRSEVTDDRITIYTQPKTDLWQRTYYGFQNDNAPVLQMKTSEKYFSFIVKTEFDSKARFDQCGIVVYQDSENWIKASIEYENEQYQRLGSVVTNHGYSDWATTDIDASVKSMWYRLSRRESDYCIECGTDGSTFRQMRICHLWKGDEKISFGVYACSPVEGSFRAEFTNMQITECMWETHQ